MDRLFDYMHNSDKKKFGKHFVENEKRHLHVINDIVICKFLDFFVSVNKHSYSFRQHESEQDALDYVLDFYKGTKVEQVKLFN